MTKTNPHRGEIAFTLFDNSGTAYKYSLRPTFETLCEIEQLTGKGILTLAKEFQRGDISLRDATAILFACIKQEDKKKPSLSRVGALVVQTGLPNLFDTLGDFFAAALLGGMEDEGEAGKPEPVEA